ncbi:protein get1 [Aureobasidium pullulans]|nr:protein get1 [Aureobasidium pullulans]
MSLLLAVFLLNLAIHLINTLGAATLNELLWVLYNKLPTPTAKDAQNSARLKKEVVRLKREMNAVSAQDEFARWAKLRRTHDKAVAEYEKSSMWNPDYALMCKDGILTDATQQPRFKTPKPSSTRRPMFFAGWAQTFWFSRQALFWLPQGWVPGYVEWLLAFPRAPKGSISIQLWGIACASVISLSSEAIVATYVLATKRPDMKAGKQEQEPQAFKSDGATTTSAEGKKEL